VCIIGGAGYVGLVTGAALASLGHDVRCVDSDAERIAGLQAGRPPFFEGGLQELVARMRAEGRLHFTDRTAEGTAGAEVVLLCVGTPAAADGSPDLRHVFEAAGALRPHLQSCRVLAVKSTVPPGTARRVQAVLDARGPVPCSVASCPEFLREGDAVADFLKPSRVVLGVRSPETGQVLETLHRGIEAPLLVTTPENAEMIKYASNVLLAAKVSLANELADICERVGADVVEVVRGVGYDPRIGPGFLRAGLGFGGPCLDKDLRALIQTARTHGYTPRILQAVRDVNAGRPGAVLAKVRHVLTTLREQRVGVLGLAFKPGTSDVRDSRAITLIHALRRSGSVVRAYDPRAMDEARRLIPDLECTDRPEDLAAGADCLVVATEWPEFLRLDWAGMARRMRRPVLVDGRNLLDPALMAACGFRYEAMGRRSPGGSS